MLGILKIYSTALAFVDRIIHFKNEVLQCSAIHRFNATAGIRKDRPQGDLGCCSTALLCYVHMYFVSLLFHTSVDR